MSQPPPEPVKTNKKTRNRIRRNIGWQLVQGEHQCVGLAFHEAYVLEATLHEFPKDRTVVAVRNGNHIALLP